MKRILLTILLLLALVGTGWGATHTVCASGCDHTTIAAAEADATCDTVSVGTGTYNESNPTFSAAKTWIPTDGNGTVTITNSGAGAYAATFAANANAVSITGFVFDGATSKATALALPNGANNKTLTSCTFKDGATYLVQGTGASNSGINIQSCTFQGSPSTAAVIFTDCPDLVVNACPFNHTSARGIYLLGDTGAVSITNNILNCALSNRFFNSLAGGTTTITGNTGTITLNSTGSNSFVSIATAAKNGSVTISNNNITLPAENTPVGAIVSITNGGHAVTVDGNRFTMSSTTATVAGVQITNQPAPQVTNNNIIMATTSATSLGAINIGSTGTEVGAAVVTGNIISSQATAKQIILVGTDVSGAGDNKIDGAIITGNIITGASAASVHCIEYGYNKNGVISKNSVTGCGYGIVVKGNAENYTTGYVAYNILKDQVTESLRLKGVQNVPVYNNTFSIGLGKTVTNGSLYITVNAESANAPSTGAIVKNNIFSTQANQRTINCDADSATGLTVDTNIHYPFRAVIGATTYTDLAAWNAVSGIGTDIASDPLFKSSTDFHLKSGSPAINAGINICTGVDTPLIGCTGAGTGTYTDYAGNPIKGLPDIGAYEFSGGRACFRIGGKFRCYSN